MTEHEEVIDSKVASVASHIRKYVATDGKDGHLYYGMPSLLLTTRGRKSGKLYRTALIYGQDGDRYLLIPSDGGASEHPAWYLNLVENPEVKLQVLADKFNARASIANAEEKPRLWQIMAAIHPRYNTYQKKTEREIPVVILERI